MTATIPALTTTCPGCGDEGGDLLLEGRDRLIGADGSFAVVRCSACRLAFTSPRLEPEDFDRFYPATYTSHAPAARRRGLGRSLVNRMRLEAIVRRGPYKRIFREPAGRLLDVGCGRGELAATFAAHGWRVSGIEPSPDAAAIASELGVDAHAGTLEDAPWSDGAFDAIVMNHALEHIDDLPGALERCHALVQPDGLLGIAVPNFGSWQRRLFGTYWFQLDLPRHLQHFDRDSLTGLLARHGFTTVEVTTGSMRPSLLSSLQYRMFGRRRYSGRAFRALVWLLAPVLSVVDRVAEGDCLHVIARADGERPA